MPQLTERFDFTVETDAVELDDDDAQQVQGYAQAEMAYSDCKPGIIVNRTGPARVLLDRDVRFGHDEDTVPAGTDLVDYGNEHGRDVIFNSALSPFGFGYVRLEHGFVFPPDEYTVTFEWEDDEGEVFSAALEVFIDLDLRNAD